MSIFEKIQKAIKNGNYALRPHTVTHMLSEGFEEGNIVEAIIMVACTPVRRIIVKA